MKRITRTLCAIIIGVIAAIIAAALAMNGGALIIIGVLVAVIGGAVAGFISLDRDDEE